MSPKLRKILLSCLPLLIVISLSYWAIKELFIPGFFPMHDDTQVARVYTMYTSLKDGMFPVRWVTDLGYGYGYPIFNFYAPLAYYVGAIFMFIGFDALVATKFMISLGIILAGVTMYLFAKQLWGIMGGIISAILYVYAPYHALNVFVRGDIAEVWAYAFIPLVFYGLFAIYQRAQDEKKGHVWQYIVWGAIGYAGVILSHNLTAMMVTPFMLVFIIFLLIQLPRKQKSYAIRHMLYALFFGVLLAAFYWLPVFGEMHYTNVLSQIGGGADYKDHFVCPAQLLNSPWGFGGSTAGCIDGMSFKIGKIHIILSVLSLFFLPLLYKKDKKGFKIGIAFISFILISIVLMLPITKPVWDSIPLMKFLQFPWRFLMIVSIFTSVLSGGVIYLVQQISMRSQKAISIGGVLVCLYIIISYSTLFKPQIILNKTAKDYTSEHALHWTASKISDEYMPNTVGFSPTTFKKPKQEVQVVTKDTTLNVMYGGAAKVTILNKKTQIIYFQVENRKGPTIVLARIAPFPAWSVVSSNKDVTFSFTHEGILIYIPKGKIDISILFRQTPIEQVGNLLSIAGIVLLFLGIIYERRTRYGKKTS